MNLSYYDINPGILGLIIWGLISYFMRGKKKQKNQKTENILPKEESFDLDYFKNILEPQQNIVLDPPIPIDESFQDIDAPLEIKDVEISEKKQKAVRYLVEDLQKKKKSKIELFTMLKHKNSLKSAFIMKEILDKPLCLRNYE